MSAGQQRALGSETRILYVDEVSEIGGGGLSFNYLMRYLNRERFEPVLLGPPGPILDLARESGIQTVPYTFQKRYISVSVGGYEIPLNPYRLLYRLADAFKIIRMIRRTNIDIVHTNNLDSHITGWFLNKLFGVPVVWHIRIHWPRSLYRIPWPTRIIFVSKALRNASLGSQQDGDSRSVVIYNGIEPDDFQVSAKVKSDILTEFDLSGEHPIIGTVGRFQPIKRQDLFLRLVASLVSNGIEVTGMIVGSEIQNRTGINYSEYLQNLTRELEIENYVVFTGQRPDVARLLAAMDLFVFCSDRDSNPRTVLEAMSAGKPIVATNSGGVPEMLDNGRAGLLVETGSVEQLTQAVSDLLHNPTFAAKLGQIARQRVEDIYTVQGHARQVERVYEDILIQRS